MKLKIILIASFLMLGYTFYDIHVATAPTTLNDFFLPGSQPGDSGTFENPSKCDNCHGGYDQEVEPDFFWKGSMMAQAARDPLFFAAVAIANQDAPQSGDLCIRCHSPKGWLEGRSLPTDGSSLTSADMEGITCDFCHKLVKPTALGVNPYPNDALYTSQTYPLDQAYLATIDSIPPTSANGMYINDISNSKRGPFSDAAATHQFIYSPFHSTSDICGTCHDVSNPVFSPVLDGNGNIIDYAPNTFDAHSPSFDTYKMLPIERTYSEWKMSAYNSPGGVPSTAFGGNLTSVSTCQDCHMRDATGYGCNKNPPLRSNLPLHDLSGANTFIPRTLYDLFPNDVDTIALNAGMERSRYMLRNAASMDLSVDEQNQQIQVKITNETGHKLPSGYPEGRRIWINVQAWGENGEVYESGHYDFETAVLTHDNDAKIYETKPGISPGLASGLGLTGGPSFHFVLNDTIYKDNRIPPRGFTNANFVSIQAAPIDYSYADGEYWDFSNYQLSFTPIAVKTTLYYQTASKEYIDFLKDENTSDNWGQTLFDLWTAHGKSRPELMVEKTWGAPIVDSDEDGHVGFVDCNDGDPLIFPGASELNDCLDNDCDGKTDEDYTSETKSVWTGCNENEFWDDPGNWNLNAVPGTTDNVIIPANFNGTYTPEIYTSMNIHSLEIESGASLTIEESATLNVHFTNASLPAALVVNGNLNVEGTINIDSDSANGIYISETGMLTNSGTNYINSYSLFGIENKGLFRQLLNGVSEIIDFNGNAVLNTVDSRMEINGQFIIRN